MVVTLIRPQYDKMTMYSYERQMILCTLRGCCGTHDYKDGGIMSLAAHLLI